MIWYFFGLFFFCLQMKKQVEKARVNMDCSISLVTKWKMFKQKACCFPSITIKRSFHPPIFIENWNRALNSVPHDLVSATFAAFAGLSWRTLKVEETHMVIQFWEQWNSHYYHWPRGVGASFAALFVSLCIFLWFKWLNRSWDKCIVMTETESTIFTQHLCTYKLWILSS